MNRYDTFATFTYSAQNNRQHHYMLCHATKPDLLQENMPPKQPLISLLYCDLTNVINTQIVVTNVINTQIGHTQKHFFLVHTSANGY